RHRAERRRVSGVRCVRRRRRVPDAVAAPARAHRDVERHQLDGRGDAGLSADRLTGAGVSRISFGTERHACRTRPDARRHEGRPMSTAIVEDVEVSTDHWIGGARVASSDTFADVSPIDEATIAEVARGGASEVDAAVEAAHDAFPAWALLGPRT